MTLNYFLYFDNEIKRIVFEWKALKRKRDIPNNSEKLENKSKDCQCGLICFTCDLYLFKREYLTVHFIKFAELIIFAFSGIYFYIKVVTRVLFDYYDNNPLQNNYLFLKL